MYWLPDILRILKMPVTLTPAKILTWAGGIAATLVVSLVTYNVRLVAAKIDSLDQRIGQTNDHMSARIAAIELWQAEVKGNRFTSKDGAELLARLNELQRDVAKLPTAYPPTWVADDLKSIKEKLDDNGKSIARLEATLAAIKPKG